MKPEEQRPANARCDNCASHDYLQGMSIIHCGLQDWVQGFGGTKVHDGGEKGCSKWTPLARTITGRPT